MTRISLRHETVTLTENTAANTGKQRTPTKCATVQVDNISVCFLTGSCRLSFSQPLNRSPQKKKNQCYFLSPRNVTATALHCYHGLCDRKKSKQGSSLHDIKILDVNTHSYEKKGEF